ncbi:MAG: MgtC/SapB family protein [Deltaproteobacteria bacterium]|nr:MgtC/SapB family protein [Deltaproteobacteria bacterium]
MLDWHLLWVTLGKLSLAALIGGAIGFERETHGEAAGLRTNIMVCVGACLMMMLSLFIHDIHQHLPAASSVVRLDPGRIASYAIASMGFLGAGAIITGKGTVRGLTTAAGLWLATGMGLAVGAGFYLPALICAFLSLISLFVLRRAKRIFPRDTYTILTLRFNHMDHPLDRVNRILAEHRIRIQFTGYQVELPGRAITYRLRMVSKETIPWDHIVRQLAETSGLEDIRWQEGEVP